MPYEKQSEKPEFPLPKSFVGRLTTILPDLSLEFTEISVPEIMSQVAQKIVVSEFQTPINELTSPRQKTSFQDYVDRIVANIIYQKLNAVTLCPNPECNNESALRRIMLFRGYKETIDDVVLPCENTGHKYYFCAHPQCLKKAIKFPWRYMAHYWNSPLGIQHYLYSFLSEEENSAYMDLVDHYEKNQSSYIIPKNCSIGSVVYLIKSGDKYKIGRTTNIVSRMSSIKTSSPEPIELIHTIRTLDSEYAEKYLHNEFSDKRIRGEWFDLSSEDVNRIKSIASDLALS